MLHREQARSARGGRVDLRVDVLDVVADRLRRDHELRRDLLVRVPRASSLSTSTSRWVSPAGPSRRRATRWPAAPSTASTASASRRPALTSERSSPAASCGGGQRGRVAAPASPGRRRRRRGSAPGARSPRRTARAGSRSRRAARGAARRPDRAAQRLGLVKHPFGDVGMQANPFPFAGAERPGLVPDRVRDARAGRDRARDRPAAACEPLTPTVRAAGRRPPPGPRPHGHAQACRGT